MHELPTRVPRMKYSEITIKDVADYLRLSFEDMTDDEKQELSVILDSSREFVRSQTGLTEDVLDAHADIVILIYCLCQHQYDNRCHIIEKGALNPMTQAILTQYAVNFL